MQKLIIMQGPPGGGKTYMAEILARIVGARICSTDSYMVDESGKYEFLIERLGAAHTCNQKEVDAALDKGKNVIVDNTNIRAWEAKPYVQMGLKYQCGIHFVRCSLQRPNSHGVPEDKVFLMRQTMEHLSVATCLAAKAPWEV